VKFIFITLEVNTVRLHSKDRSVNAFLRKDKVHTRTGHEGPEEEYRYSSTLSSTSDLEGGGWSKSLPGRFIPENNPVSDV
jgi:hypothetical protein